VQVRGHSRHVSIGVRPGQLEFDEVSGASKHSSQQLRVSWARQLLTQAPGVI
jgi:hypothetical protein